MKAKAFAARSPTTPLAQTVIDRREPGPKDVVIDILYCGVCHSDLHTARGNGAASSSRACRGTRSSAASPRSGAR